MYLLYFCWWEDRKAEFYRDEHHTQVTLLTHSGVWMGERAKQSVLSACEEHLAVGDWSRGDYLWASSSIAEIGYTLLQSGLVSVSHNCSSSTQIPPPTSSHLVGSSSWGGAGLRVVEGAELVCSTETLGDADVERGKEKSSCCLTQKLGTKRWGTSSSSGFRVVGITTERGTQCFKPSPTAAVIQLQCWWANRDDQLLGKNLLFNLLLPRIGFWPDEASLLGFSKLGQQLDHMNSCTQGRFVCNS